MRLDQLLIGFLGGPQMLGLFFFARRLFQMLSDMTVGVFTPVSNVLLASMQAEPEKRRKAFMIATYAATAVALPTFVGLFVTAKIAVPLVFGAQWVDAVTAVQGFAVIGMIAGIGIVQAALIRSQGRAEWWFWYQAVVQFSALPLIALLYSHGLGVVMTALALRTMVFWPLSVRETLRILDTRPMDYFRNLRGPLGASLVMAGAMAVVPLIMPEGHPAHWVLLAQACVGLVAYLGAAALLSWGQAQELWTLLRQRKAKAT
jgi:teichuronic acid exporter